MVREKEKKNEKKIKECKEEKKVNREKDKKNVKKKRTKNKVLILLETILNFKLTLYAKNKYATRVLNLAKIELGSIYVYC